MTTGEVFLVAEGCGDDAFAEAQKRTQTGEDTMLVYTVTGKPLTLVCQKAQDPSL